jgi:hypothetical protein
MTGDEGEPASRDTGGGIMIRKENGMFRFRSLTVIALAFCAAATWATERTYVVSMSGAQEVPGPGDPDGTGSGTITLNDVTGLVSWNFTYQNITAPTLMHIHTGAAGVSGGILINLGVATSGGAGTLISSTVHGNLAQVTSVITNPQGFYVNIHNASFPGGAVRGQIGCDMDADCDDGAFCTGIEMCNVGTAECVPGTPPCDDDQCNEITNVCPAVTSTGAIVLMVLVTGAGAALFRRQRIECPKA